MNLDFDVIEPLARRTCGRGSCTRSQLTAIAAIGGLFFGTLLALVRLSPIKPLAWSPRATST